VVDLDDAMATYELVALRTVGVATVTAGKMTEEAGIMDDVGCCCWPDGKGGLLEPRQRLVLGPWRLTVPSFLCNCRVA